MGTEESYRNATPYKILITQDETLNKPLPSHLSTPIQGYHNCGSTATPFVNSYTAGFSLPSYIWANQEYSTPLQYDSQHDPRSLSSHPVVSEGFALTISEREQSIFTEEKMDSLKLCDGNLQPKSIIGKKSRENGNGSSMAKNARDGSFWRSSVSSDEGHDSDDTNSGLLTKKQRCDMVLANGDVAEKVAIQNFKTVHVNGNSALEVVAINSTELNVNLGTSTNGIGANPLLSKLEEDEIRKERKRQLNRESARRSRIRKQQEMEELQNSVDNLMRENSSLKKKLMNLSEDCVELTDLNDSIEKELVEMYGPELIADLVATKPA